MFSTPQFTDLWYSQLSRTESDKDFNLDENTSNRRRWPFCSFLYITAKGVMILLAIIGLLSSQAFFLDFGKWVNTNGSKYGAPTWPSCSCGGTTVAEAKERGCIFTPLSISWLPPHCVDQELADDFDKQGPGPNGEWEYWDANETRRLSRQELGLLADTNESFLTTQAWHVTHCVFTWRKHYRSHWTGVTIERRSNGLDHIAHCGKVFAHDAKPLDIATVSGIALNADEA